MVETGKRTMLYMATSLALTAAGIICCYLLLEVVPVEGKTMNAVMTEQFIGNLTWMDARIGRWFVLITLASESVLLLVAAQAGFVDGPRVMANMAHGSWLPHRFALLSDRLTMLYGIVVVSLSAILTLLYTKGDIGTLVLMYSINVFLTFSLSEAGMIRYWFLHRARYPDWSRHITIHLVGFVLCVTILVVSVIEKFTAGGWITLLITSVLIVLCYAVRREYERVKGGLKRLDDTLMTLPFQPDLGPLPAKDASAPTAVMIVRKFDGLAIHALLTARSLFGNYFKNVVFVSVGVIDAGTFKGANEVQNLQRSTEEDLKSFVEYANCLGVYAEYRFAVGIHVLEKLEKLCKSVAKEFPKCVFMAGKLVFEKETVLQGLLHNHTPAILQRRLQFEGLSRIILPVRVLADSDRHRAARASCS